MVRDVTVYNCPVKIRLVKTKKRIVRTNEEFSDDDDWLQGLSLRAINRSDKTVTYVGVDLVFRKTKDQTAGMPAAFRLNYGSDPLWLEPGDPIPAPTVKPIGPGEEAEIVLTDYLHDQLKDYLARTGFFPNHTNLELDIRVLGFSDETMWNLGKWLKRDPTQLKKPLPGWRMLDDAFREPTRPKEPQSSAANRTAFFMLAGFRSRSRTTLFATEPLSAPQNECGAYIEAQPRCGNTGDTGIVCRFITHEWSASSYENYRVEPYFARCVGRVNGIEFSCSNDQPAMRAVLCSIPCGERYDTCLLNSDCCSGLCNGGQCADPVYCDQQPILCGSCFEWSSETCQCEPTCGGSPIIIDVAGDGFNLTDAAGGVSFDLNSDGQREKISWVAANADDAWLALDRNGNGMIDNGRELFGNFTLQPVSADPNGFLALAQYDAAAAATVTA
jgi:hypothetical protein